MIKLRRLAKYLILLPVLVIPFLFFEKKAGFTLKKIASSLEYRSEWAVDDIPLSAPLDEILSQPFSYIGNGSQSYVFLSQDQKYVLKFFKMKYLTPKKWLTYVVLPGLSDYRYKKLEKTEKNLSQTFGAHRKAYDIFKEESGLVFIHLNKSKMLKKKALLTHRSGEKFEVELDTVPFIVQEKAELIYDRLTRLMQNKDTCGAVNALRAFLNLIHIRGQRGFSDGDPGITNNFGFVGDRVIQLDIGRLMQPIDKDRPLPAAEVRRAGRKLKGWIQSHYPELLPELHNLLNNQDY